MSPIQIIVLALIALIILKTFKKYKKESITIREFFLWTIFWLIVACLWIFPDATQTLANWVGIGRGVDLVIYLAILILFFGLFYVIIRLERLERDVTKIVRRMALDKER